MLKLKKWLTKVNDKLYSLRGLRVVADDYFAANTTGQTHTYSLSSTCTYMLFLGKINAVGAGVYFIASNSGVSTVDAIISSALATVTVSGNTLSVKIDANYMRLTLVKVGGNIWLTPFNRIARLISERRWAAVC